VPVCQPGAILAAFTDAFVQVVESGLTGDLFRVSLFVTDESFGVVAWKGDGDGYAYPFQSVCYCTLPAGVYLDPFTWVEVSTANPDMASASQLVLSVLYEGDFDAAMGYSALEINDTDIPEGSQDTLIWRETISTQKPVSAIAFYRKSGGTDVENLTLQVFAPPNSLAGTYITMFNAVTPYFCGEFRNPSNSGCEQ
jgi:hypothetical protein